MKQLIILFIFMLSTVGYGQNTVELKLSNSNKVVIKLMFRNGSISDPAGKEGLTYLTANLITQGGTRDMTFSQIQDFI